MRLVVLLLMKVWADREEYPWYNLHTRNVAHATRYGYIVIDVPDETLARWQRTLAEAMNVLAEIDVAMDKAT